MLRHIFASCLIFALAGCHMQSATVDDVITAPAPLPEVKQSKYLFAIVYTNAAWGKTNLGLVVMNTGDIYFFDVATTIETLPEREVVSEKELTKYFEAAKFEFKKSMNKEELEKIWGASRGMDNKTLGTVTNICNDAGVFQYYIFNNIDADNINKVLVYKTGDFRQEQMDARAKPVKDMLVQLALENKIAWQLEPNGNNWCTGM